MKMARLFAASAALCLSLGLGGCVTLFPKTKPAQLYSFGGDIGQPTPTPAVAQTSPVGTLRMTLDFTRAADREQILTTAGDANAYIAQARWVAPPSVLFEEAADRAFETASPPIRLLQRADNGNATLNLRVEVQTFETDYGANWRGNPTVVVRVRTLLTRDFDEAFKKVDVIAAPTCPTPAFKLGEKVDDPLAMYLADIYTVTANLAGIPGISVPCGENHERLPIGLQLFARHFDEATLLRVAHAFERAALVVGR